MANDGSNEALGREERALGEAFYQGDAEAIRARIELEAEEATARSAIAAATGIDDAEVVAELAGLGIRVDTLAALTLIPLIDVAWADGEMDPREREAVLSAAAATGSEPGSTSYRLLEIWTQEQPPPDLTHAWQLYIRGLCAQLDDARSRRLAENLVGRARDVAIAAGSELNRAPHVSPEEEACLAALAKAFPGSE